MSSRADRNADPKFETTRIRYNHFVDLYIKYGFDAIKAYQECYKVPIRSAQSEASRLLSVPYVNDLLVKKLKAIGVDGYISKEKILARFEEVYETAKKTADRIRILEIQSKIGNLYSDNNSQTYIFNDIAKDKKISNRLNSLSDNKLDTK